jgi:hypothetical protein
VAQKRRTPKPVIAPKKRRTGIEEDLSSMSADELWSLHGKVAATLVARITAEKEVFEDRLRRLDEVLGTANETDHTLTNTLRSN